MKKSTKTWNRRLRFLRTPVFQPIFLIPGFLCILASQPDTVSAGWFKNSGQARSEDQKKNPPPLPQPDTLQFLITDEIREAQGILERTATFCSLQSDCLELHRLYSYYLDLLQLIKKQSPEDTTSISGSFKAAAIGAIQWSKEIFPHHLTSGELLALLQTIETNLPRWQKSNEAIKPYLLSQDPDRKSYVFFIYHKPLNQLLIQTHNRPIGSGASKAIFEVFTYPNWQRLALGIPKKLSRQKEVGLANEYKIFLTLTKSPPLVGIAQTHFADQFSILQKAYSPIQVSSLDPQSELTKLKLIEQVTQGVASLHQREICHSDIKEENLLISPNSSEPEELVLTDFDLAYSPRELISAGRRRPFRGTLPFVAPEILEAHFKLGPLWIEGEVSTPEKKLESQVKTALKSDVFSLATLVSNILRPRDEQWYHHCPQGQREFELWRCQQSAIPHHQWTLSQVPYQSINQLLIAALEPNPLERIDSLQFHQGIQHIRRKASTQRTPALVNLFPRKATRRFLKTIHPEIPIEVIEGSFLKTKPGSYLLSWHSLTPETRLVRFSFLDSLGQFKTYLWSFDPHHPEAILEEIEFLKTIGRIQGDPIIPASRKKTS